MDQLFDSLSEDWISQPRSPHSSQAQLSPAINSPSQISNASQSRIPRYQPRASSRLSSERPDIPPRRSSAPANEIKKLPLSEKTSSTLNTFNSRSRPTNSLKTNGSSPGSTKTPKHRGGKESTRSLLQDTVQHKPSQASPLKGQANNGTPDWKRRLKSNTGSGDQQDLFSPIGLESVFRPPTVKNKGDKKNAPRYQPVVTDDIPSSPPPVASIPRKVSDQARREEAKGTERQAKRLESFDEVLDNSRKETEEVDQLQPEPEMDNKRREQSSPQTTDRQLPEQIRAHAGETKSPRSTPRLPSYQQRSGPVPRISQWSQNPKESQLGSECYAPSERSRVTSGQTEDLNEDLSPFFVSRQHTVDGRVDYTPVVDMNQFRRKMSDLRLQQQHQPSSPTSDHGINYSQTRSPPVSPDARIPNSDSTSHSLPEDLSTGTQSFVANGGFINPRRGGRSQEGSFLRRPLSPTSPSSAQLADSEAPVPLEQNMIEAIDEKTMAFQEPTTPKRQQKDNANSFERPRSSGSPLKLFDKYDTYTNDRLQRRMSKFEETMPDSSEGVDAFEQPLAEEGQMGEKKADSLPHRSTRSPASHFSSFGDGELDDHGFESFPSPPVDVYGNQDLEDQQVLEKPMEKPGDFRFVRPSQEESRADIIHRPLRRNPSSTVNKSEIVQAPTLEENLGEDVTRTVNGKRLPYSPAKDPKPKRRRTLRTPEETKLESFRIRQDSTSTGPPTSSVLGRKRKDALYDSSVQIADPQVLAMRQMLRPRNPTPGQSRAYGKHRKGSTVVTGQRPKQLLDIQNDNSENPPKPPTQKLAGELANLALDMAQEISESARKPSVNTADFFNEAQQIMQLIRSRGRPVSKDITEEEPSSGLEDNYDDSAYPESTKEELSRPPSREGGSLRRLRQPAKLDARVVSQLRKFEEKTEVGMTLSSSLKSLKIGQPNDTAMTIELKDIARQQVEDIESDLNIRIIERKQQHSSAETVIPALPNDTQAQSFGSQTTSGPSTGQSIPTNSSRGSRNKAVIAPQTVAHLLSDQVAGMTFDHDRQVWVKSRNSSKDAGEDMGGEADPEMTDDELGAIPDLSVDEIEELRRIKRTESSRKPMASQSDHVAHRDHATSHQRGTSSNQPLEASSRPQTADGTQSNTQDTGSAPSKSSRSASNGPITETRATSWADEAFKRQQEQPQATNHPKPLNYSKDGHSEEVEHEISILEGRVSITPGRATHRQPRAVTVTFSSPLVDQIDASYFHEEDSFLAQDGNDPDMDDSHVRKASQKRTTPVARRSSTGFGRKPGYPSSSRRMSLGHQSHIARPMSRLDEQDEMSMVYIPNGGSLNLALSTPVPAPKSELTAPRTSVTTSSITFQLSPLPDFSVHQVDRPLDNVSATQPLRICAAAEADRRVSQATQEMVKKITDVEPYEPYWDYLRALDLHERNIASLHMLDDFCGRLEELDVSNNQIRELTGAPFTLRHLRIRHNCLSNLTAWNHLHNLQYLDVSGNQLQNLNGFQSLIHLRELRADDNQIEDIRGIQGLDGLIRLSLRDNQVEDVDFEGSDLKRLTDLDLRGNNLVEVSSLHQLEALKHLHLDNNNLASLSISSTLQKLKTLNLASNKLTTIDLRTTPNLRMLNLDNNSISHIPSLSTFKNLHTISWRAQSLPKGIEIDYQSCHNLTHLHLSGNVLPVFTPTSAFLNLQVLELASTGLHTLSDNFGLQCPNLRTLNLNYNALRDLRPLLGIARLQRLYLAGNRVERLRRTASVLQHVGQGLDEADLRGNPLTVGFYTPQQQQQQENQERGVVLSTSSSTDAHGTAAGSHHNEDDTEQQARARAYLLPHLAKESDTQARERLDEDTKLRRRVYEMLLVSACPVLRILDGIGIRREEVVQRDGVWDRLVELGVLKPCI